MLAKRKKLVYAFFIIFLCIIAGVMGCNNDKKFEYELVKPSEIRADEIKQWYNDLYKNQYIESIKIDENQHYLLICAGEVSFEGAGIVLAKVEEEKEEIKVYCKLVIPEERKISGEMTYPKLLMKLKFTGEKAITGILDTEDYEKISIQEQPLYSEVKGVFVGMIDANSIEINVINSNNFPGKQETGAYRLSDEVKGVFQKDHTLYLGIKKGDEVIFACRKNEQEQWVITFIDLLNKVGKGNNDMLKGEFLGWIDGNSVEIKVDNQVQAFRVNDEAKAYLQEKRAAVGDMIEFKLDEDRGQKVIITVKVTEK